MKRKLIFILSIALMACMFATSAFAAGNGSVLRKSNHGGSKIFAMGDSRTYQMFAGSSKNPNYNGYGLKGAAIATWGGHYQKQGNYGLMIDTAASKAVLKEAVQKELKSSGKAHVFIMATINIANMGRSGYKSFVSGQVATAKYAYKWTAKYKGKTVHPTVWCTSLIPWPGQSVAGYNKYLKSVCAKTAGVNYVAISNGGGYASAKDPHYSRAGAKKIWNTLHAKAGHHYNAWSVGKKATLSANGYLQRKCSACGHVQKSTIQRPTSFTLSATSLPCTGKALKPTVTVKAANGTVIPTSFYSLSYANNVKPGTGKVKVTFKTRYSGSKILEFNIEDTGI